MRQLICFLAILMGGLAVATPIVPEVFTGTVTGVTDGDTITVLVDKKPVKVRLEGIDAPESKQAFGSRSKQALSEMVFGKSVTIRKTGQDRYGRNLGFVTTGDLDINAKMIENGWAWHFKKYNSEPKLAKLEEEARSNRRGLWSDPNPLPPWDFRAKQKPDGNAPATQFWLNTSSNVRHNQKCEHFQKSKKGRLCGPTEGKACGICGG